MTRTTTLDPHALQNANISNPYATANFNGLTSPTTTELNSTDKAVATIGSSVIQSTHKEVNQGKAFNSIWPSVQVVHDLMHDYHDRLDANHGKVQDIRKLQCEIRNVNGPIDWSQNKEMQARLCACRKHGVVIEEGKHTFNEEEKAALLANFESSIDGYMSSNKRDETRLTMQMNDLHRLTELLADLIKKLHEAAMAIIRR